MRIPQTLMSMSGWKFKRKTLARKVYVYRLFVPGWSRQGPQQGSSRSRNGFRIRISWQSINTWNIQIGDNVVTTTSARRRRVLTSLAVLVGSAVALAGCGLNNSSGGAASSNKALTVWHEFSGDGG